VSVDPTNSIAEVLGRPARSGFNPSSEGFVCPYIDTTCKKRSQANEDPYPVCTIRKRDGSPVCVCPKRFLEIDFLKDVIEHAWPGEKPANPQIAREVQMKDVGNVDFVIADTEDGKSIG